MAIKKFEHVGIQVKDLETTIAFYTNVVGLELLKKEGHVDPATYIGIPGNQG